MKKVKGILFAIAFISVMLGCGCADGDSYTAMVSLMSVGVMSAVCGIFLREKEKTND